MVSEDVPVNAGLSHTLVSNYSSQTMGNKQNNKSLRESKGNNN